MLMVTCTLFGCATPREFYHPKSIEISKPGLNEEATARPGDDLLAQGLQSEYDAVSSTTSFSAGAFTLPAGRYLKTSTQTFGTSRLEYFSWDEVSSSAPNGSVFGGDKLKEIVLVAGRNSLLVSTFGGRIYGADSHPLQRVKISVLDRDSFQQTLIYSGKVGNKINISYREFSGGMARGAFTNTAEYDLSESKIIGYRGAQIEVLEATNQIIRYKVISNFSKAKI